MKKILCILLLMLFVKASSSQYTVTKIIGNVKASGVDLKPGSKLSDDDKLWFSSPKDMIRLIVAGKGIFIVSPSPKAEKDNNALVEILRFCLQIKSKEGYLSGRSEVRELMPQALETESVVNKKNHFTTNNKYLFNKNMYNTGNGRFFLQIEQTGAKPIIRSLKTNGDTLMISAYDFEIKDADTGNVTYKLGYYSKEKNTSELLVEIKPYIDITGEMETIIQLVIAANPQKEKSILMQNAYAEVYEALGKPSEILFKKAFKKLYAEEVK